MWDRLNVSSLEHTFENYKVTDASRAIWTEMKLIADGKNKPKFVFLYGSPGNGKTHLIEALLIAWAEQGRWGRYWTMSQIMRQLKNSIKAGEYENNFKMFCKTPILVIDDYGAGVQETKFEIADIEDIINERYQRRYRNENNITIMATNQDIKEIPTRITDRFYDPEFGLVLFNGEKSYRRRKIAGGQNAKSTILH